ncbi:ROK family protein [Clavibacter michiganensis]|uniref:ROK family protein n=1 Tax=Clavibacter michiganensis TaxID=28447 RepID=UPI001BE084F6|nr:ROK family protein [Clavibacter michiganensis]MBT1634297.1 ROK family transcriptional regulator [Clavibacter michiganensis]
MRRGTNLPAIGGYNRTVVLDAIRRATDGASRSEVAERTGLSAQTVTNVARRLIDEGLVREGGTVIRGPGKPRTLLHLVAAGRLAVGVHVDPAVITAVLLDLEGAVLRHASSPTPSASRPDDVVALVARLVDGLIRDAGVDRSAVLGVGIAAPGPIDVAEGLVLDPPMLPRWRHVPLRSALATATGLPVLLEKDVTAAAVAELWFGDGGRRNLAFVYYGTGFGTGLVLGGEPVRGASSNAGDAGHIMVASRGRRCTCGRIGCVGELITPHALVRQAVEGGALAPGDVSDAALAEAAASGDAVDMRLIGEAFHALAARADAEDGPARRIVRAAARHLAHAVVIQVNLLDLDEVVCGGPFWQPISRVVLELLPEEVRRSPALIAKHPVRIVESAIGDDVAAVGAACLVLDNAFSPRPSAMLIRP